MPQCIARHKPILNPRHIQAQLRWCNAHQHWSVNQWRQVIWSNDRTFWLGQYGQVWVSHPVGHAYHPKYVILSESRSPSVHIWACFSGRSYGSCQIFTGTMTSGRYQTILQQHLLPYLHRHFCQRTDVIFQQDGATCHTARSVQQWLHAHNLQLLPWPAKSADLSPIENLWNVLVRRVEDMHPRTIEELTTSINESWESLDNDLIENLVSSVPTWVAEVIHTHGYYSKY